MTLNELNEGIVSDKLKDVRDIAKGKAESIVKTVRDEIDDNKKAFGVFKNKLRSKFGGTVPPSPEEFKKALEQLKDNGRMAIIGAIGVTPGSTITLPLAMKVAKKMGIQLTPSKTF